MGGQAGIAGGLPPRWGVVKGVGEQSPAPVSVNTGVVGDVCRISTPVTPLWEQSLALETAELLGPAVILDSCD